MTTLAHIRLSILNAAIPVTRILGRIHAPWTHHAVTGIHYHHAISRLIPGQPLLTRKNGEFSNLLISGEYTHAAVYVGHRRVVMPGSRDILVLPCVVEAVSPLVRITDLATFFSGKDRVIAMTPLFCADRDMERAAEAALAAVGSPYDYLFQIDRLKTANIGQVVHKRRAFYCSELVWDVYRDALGASEIPFALRETMGVMTVTPQDIANARAHWRTAWDSRTINGFASLQEQEEMV